MPAKKQNAGISPRRLEERSSSIAPRSDPTAVLGRSGEDLPARRKLPSRPRARANRSQAMSTKRCHLVPEVHALWRARLEGNFPRAGKSFPAPSRARLLDLSACDRARSPRSSLRGEIPAFCFSRHEVVVLEAERPSAVEELAQGSWSNRGGIVPYATADGDASACSFSKGARQRRACYPLGIRVGMRFTGNPAWQR